MEWVETTGKSLEEAKDLALDRLGVAADEAEFEVIEEPRSGLFGRVRGEARVRARVMPASVRPKQERRNRGRAKGRDGESRSTGKGSSGKGSSDEDVADTVDAAASPAPDTDSAPAVKSTTKKRSTDRNRGQRSNQPKEKRMDDEQGSPVTPEEVGDAAVAFMSGLAEAFGAEATTVVDIEGTDLEVRVTGSDLGLMVGPGGRTLTAVQDLVRVASQRRLGDHDTRLRIDVGGYREKRREALAKFTQTVAAKVLEEGKAVALEPMASADRKVVHDTVIEIEGVTSRSEGDDPTRRVVIVPE
jgi:spoIIIJ-associated protein